MFTDYKFWYIRRDDDGFITECAVRFYEGTVTTMMERGDGGILPVTRYRRSKRLERGDLPQFATREFKKEISGSDCVLFTNYDFGKIKTDQELAVFLNGELKKDLLRQSIVEQR